MSSSSSSSNTYVYRTKVSISHTIKIIIHVVMRDEKEGRKKEERSKQGHTNKAKQHSTPKAVTLYFF